MPRPMTITEKILADVVNGCGDSFEHHVIALSAGDPFFPMRTASFHSLGLERGQVSLRTMRVLRERIAGIRPDLVQGWLYHGNFASMTLGRR